MDESNCPIGDNERQGQTDEEVPGQPQQGVQLVEGLVGEPPLQVVVHLALPDQGLTQCVEEHLKELVDQTFLKILAYLEEWVEHTKDHPDIDHLGIRSRWKCTGETDKTARKKSLDEKIMQQLTRLPERGEQ